MGSPEGDPDSRPKCCRLGGRRDHTYCILCSSESYRVRAMVTVTHMVFVGSSKGGVSATPLNPDFMVQWKRQHKQFIFRSSCSFCNVMGSYCPEKEGRKKGISLKNVTFCGVMGN